VAISAVLPLSSSIVLRFWNAFPEALYNAHIDIKMTIVFQK